MENVNATPGAEWDAAKAAENTQSDQLNWWNK